jgi:hypothetical protein
LQKKCTDSDKPRRGRVPRTGSALSTHLVHLRVPEQSSAAPDPLRALALVDAVIPDPEDAFHLVALHGRAPTLPERVAFARGRRIKTQRSWVHTTAAIEHAIRSVARAWLVVEPLPESEFRNTLVEMLDAAARHITHAASSADPADVMYRVLLAHERARDALGLALVRSGVGDQRPTTKDGVTVALDVDSSPRARRSRHAGRRGAAMRRSDVRADAVDDVDAPVRAVVDDEPTRPDVRMVSRSREIADALTTARLAIEEAQRVMQQHVLHVLAQRPLIELLDAARMHVAVASSHDNPGDAQRSAELALDLALAVRHQALAFSAGR